MNNLKFELTDDMKNLKMVSKNVSKIDNDGTNSSSCNDLILKKFQSPYTLQFKVNFTDESGDVELTGTKTIKQIKGHSKTFTAVEEIYNYEKKLNDSVKAQKTYQKNEYGNEYIYQQEKNKLEDNRNVIKTNDKEITELFKRNLQDQSTTSLITDTNIKNNVEVRARTRVMTKNKQLQTMEIKPSLIKVYENPLGKITMKNYEVPKEVLRKSDPTLNLTKRKALILTEQVNKMRCGLEKLNAVFEPSYTEKYKNDIEYLMKNITPHIRKCEREKKLTTSTKSINILPDTTL